MREGGEGEGGGLEGVARLWNERGGGGGRGVEVVARVQYVLLPAAPCGNFSV